MIDEGRFGVKEAIWLTAITISAKVFYTSPALAVSLVGNTSWYMTWISAGVGALGFTFIYFLLKRFPGKDIVAIFYDAMGGIIGFIFSAALGLYLLLLAINRVYEFSEVAKTYVLPTTPSSIVIGLFVFGVCFMSFLGLESLARFSRLLIFIMLSGFLLVVLMGAMNYDINRLFPFFGYGMDKILIHGAMRSSVYGEIVILAVFAGSLQGIHHIKKIGYASLIISCIFISTSVLLISLSFPYYIAEEITAPMFHVASIIDYGRFVQRVEAIFYFIWFISSFISVTAVFYCFVSMYCKMFKIRDTHPIILGTSIVLFSATMIQSNKSVVVFESIQTLRQVGWIPPFILPLIALLVAKIRGKGVKSNA